MRLGTSLHVLLVLFLLILDVPVLLLHFGNLESLLLLILLLLVCLVLQLLLVLLPLLSFSNHSLVLLFVGMTEFFFELLAGHLAVDLHFHLLFFSLCVGWVESVELLFDDVVKEVLILSLDLIHCFLLLSNLSHLFLLECSVFGFTLLLYLLLFLVEFS